MASFLSNAKIKIKRQEGDTADVIFTFPAELDLTDATAIFRVVKNTCSPTGNINTVVINKSTTAGITIVGQDLTVAIAPKDTKGLGGNLLSWELEVTDLLTYGVVTAATGSFEVVKELIK
jgi:hypothetical protein